MRKHVANRCGWVQSFIDPKIERNSRQGTGSEKLKALTGVSGGDWMLNTVTGDIGRFKKNRITSKGIGARQASTENQTLGKVTEPPKPDTVGKIVSQTNPRG